MKRAGEEREKEMDKERSNRDKVDKETLQMNERTKRRH